MTQGALVLTLPGQDQQTRIRREVLAGELRHGRPGMGYESIVVAHAPGRSVWNGGGRVGVYVENKNRSDLQRSGHPTQKPLALMEALVSDFTDPGELICDPFAGSGTTGVACKRLGRRFIGWEREPKYHAIAERRIRDAREQFRLDLPRVKPKQATLDIPTAGVPARTQAPAVRGSGSEGGALPERAGAATLDSERA